jgi:hypothetical protein
MTIAKKAIYLMLTDYNELHGNKEHLKKVVSKNIILRLINIPSKES